MNLAHCIGCGCHDHQACPNGCWWLRVDRQEGLGVCSECEEHVEAWDQGERTMRCELPADDEELDREELERLDATWQQRPYNCAAGQHAWNNGGYNPTHCLACGMSIHRHAALECP